jgi:hypothetical protein
MSNKERDHRLIRAMLREAHEGLEPAEQTALRLEIGYRDFDRYVDGKRSIPDFNALSEAIRAAKERRQPGSADKERAELRRQYWFARSRVRRALGLES